MGSARRDQIVRWLPWDTFMGGNAISQATAQFMSLIDFYYNTNIDKKTSG